jgi:DnaJ-like protein
VAAREITLDDVLEAGRVLFGPAFAVGATAGKSWRDELRSAFRRRALEAHPDRSALSGRTETDLHRDFHAVNEAYRLLSSLKAGPLPSSDARTGPPPRPRPAPPPRAAGAAPRQPGSAAPARPGPAAVDPRNGPPRGAGLPRRKLQLAEFLYYSGRVPWTAFAESIAWQRIQRPAVGRIAVQLGFLASSDVAEILWQRRSEGAQRQPFGEYAVRRGWLTPFQLLAMLGQQLRLQRPIGQYFVERGLIAEHEIEEIRGTVLRHNARWIA